MEDDAALAELLAYGLRTRGYRFVAYRNGREALRELIALDAQGTHPLLLLDVDLPALDGYSIFAALQRVRAVTIDDARAVAERVLSQPMTLAVVGPKSMKGLRGVHA